MSNCDTHVEGARPAGPAIELHVFIVNYNSWHMVEKCLESLQTETVHTVWLLDNSTNPDEGVQLDRLAAKYENVITHQFGENLGFGTALNYGIALADLKDDSLIWLLNPDTKVREGAVSNLIKGLVEENYDVVSPLIITGDESAPVVWFAGGTLDAAQVKTTHSRLGAQWDPSYSPGPVEESTFITGAAMMMSYGTWLDIGGFREDFFLYWEDADLSRRAVASGRRLGVVNSAVIWHAVGGTAEVVGKSAHYYYYMQRNRLWFGRQWQSRRSILLGGGLRETIALTFRPVREKSHRFRKLHASFVGLAHGIRR